MHESPVLGALAMRAHEAHTCLECIRPAVPAALFASLRAGPVDDKGEWVILVSQPAAAAKLRQLIHDGITQTLSPKENDLLKMLAEHLNDLLPREQALKKIWGSDTYFNGRSMDVYIAKLRKYLKDDPKIEIVNIHGNGFRLVVQ